MIDGNSELSKRRFLGLLAGGGAVLMLMGRVSSLALAADGGGIGKVVKTDAEWKALLTPAQYDVLRQQGTEAPFTSPLLNEHREGVFACVACDLPLFSSQYKFDSGTGWPSFFDVLPGHVEKQADHQMAEERTEYHCARCGGHQGHLFNDGPQPTGLRYCNDGVALKFIPKA
jgi:peptide-methionine (R)-S-oxide reductase